MMLRWNEYEIAQAAGVAEELSTFPVNRRSSFPQNAAICLSVEHSSHLESDLHWSSSGLFPVGVVPVRHLFELLGFDERLPFRWRFEHKLVQALILNHFCPGCVPVTCGLSRYRAASFSTGGSDELRQHLLPYQVKRTMGYGADPNCESEVKGAVASLLGESTQCRSSLTDEDWILQEKLSIVEEYRVHSMEDHVVEDLTYFRHSGRIAKNQRRGPNDYVQMVLDSLPNACVASSFCGWDVADTGDGDYCIIETNLGGLYPSFQSGYRVSGFLQDASAGPVVLARLIRDIEHTYGVSISFTFEGEGSKALRNWYQSTAQWSHLLRLSAIIQDLPSVCGMEEVAATADRSSSVARAYEQVVRRLKELVRLID